jgi:predicted dehydrogenase
MKSPLSAADSPPVRFAALGLDHIHALGQVAMLLRSGAEFAAWYGAGNDFSPLFEKSFPQVRRAAGPGEILEDPSIALVTCAAVPDRRARLATLAMQHGKDVFVDKPGAVTLEELEELRAVQRETRRIWTVYFSERIESPATVKAVELVRAGAIGRPLQTVGLGPHQLGLAPRPDWFWDPQRSGGILGDLTTHQIDQFLIVTGCERAEIVSAQVANYSHPEKPEFEDFGDLLLRASGATGYARVDWYTPAGLGTWGDGRLFILGSEGAIEVRKNCDPAGREGADHLFLVDGESTRYLDCRDQPLPFAPALLRDVVERSETAMPQTHAFQVTEIALRAEAEATRLGHLAGARGTGADDA